MNILLISPNTLTVPYPVYPIGLDYVAAAVADRHQVRIADLNVVDRDTLRRIIEEFLPDVIGLSCRNIDNTEAGAPLPFIDSYRELITWLRRKSSAVLVLGGSGFTILPQPFLAAVGADYGIIGEGERFGSFVDALATGRDVATLTGVITADQPAVYPPPWSGEQQRLFTDRADHHQFYIVNGGMLNLQTKRGCTFTCLYCPYPHIEGHRHRLQPPDQVARNARLLQEAGARYLFITDSAFNSDTPHSLAVARAFKKQGVTIPWGGFFAPLRPPDGYFQALREAGLKHVEFGTESLCEQMLRVYRKPFRSDDVRAAHSQARAAGLHVAHYFLFGGPGESRATVTASLDAIEQLERAALFFFIGIRIYPNTPLYDIALAEGKITPQTDLLRPVFYEADGIDRTAVEELVVERAGGRANWIIGSGGETVAATIKTMHARRFSGPLWEYLIR